MLTFEILNARPLLDYRKACKITQGATAEVDFTPKDETSYWIKQIVANHSTLRSIHFRMTATAPKSVIMQIIRATKGHPQPFVQSSRPDWTGKERSSNPYEEKYFMQDHTAESFVEMAKQRLCMCTEVRTRTFMWEAVKALRTSKDPFLRAVGFCSLPACVWLGGKCPELHACGMKPKLADVLIQNYELSVKGEKK